MIACTVAATMTAFVAVPAGVASAAVPAFPDNIVAFPNRDFVSVEGYEGRAGETATLELTRPGIGIVGSAQAVVDGGGVAFEINHPGGSCWGAGTGLNVTPDMLPGDVVSIRFGNVPAGDTVVQDGFVTGGAVQNGVTVIVTGHVGPGVNRANTEQRIVEPALVGLVGRRDVRAIPGPLTPAPKGGYSSSLEFPAADTFLATYVFDDPDGAGPLTGADVAAVAAEPSLGERLLTWQEVDVLGNRQGITIAEFGEPGGPGFGGCPNGPQQSGPPGPTGVQAATRANGDITLTWTPAVALPGTPPITGYRAHAIGQTVTGTERTGTEKRIADPSAASTTLTGLSTAETYDVEIESVSSVGTTFPAVTAVPQTDVVAPTARAGPDGGTFELPQQVTLTANEVGSQIFFTTDGTDPVDGTGDPTLTATAFTGPITIAADTTLKFVAFDPSGNRSEIVSRTFVVTNKPTPAAPVFGPATVGQGSVTLGWTASDPSITGFGVQVHQGGSPVGALRPSAAGVTTSTVTGLTADLPYFFTVKAQNVNGYGPESAQLGPLTPQGAVVANAGPDQAVVRGTAPRTVTLTGAGSTTAMATYRWVQVGGVAADRATIVNPTSATATFTLPLYAYPATNGPRTFRLTVTTAAGSKTDDVRVTPVPDIVTSISSKWKATDFRVVGVGTLVGTTVKVHQGSLAGPVIGQAQVTAAAPPGIGDFTLRLQKAASPAVNPGTIWIESTGGGTAGPFTVANG